MKRINKIKNILELLEQLSKDFMYIEFVAKKHKFRYYLIDEFVFGLGHNYYCESVYLRIEKNIKTKKISMSTNLSYDKIKSLDDEYSEWINRLGDPQCLNYELSLKISKGVVREKINKREEYFINKNTDVRGYKVFRIDDGYYEIFHPDHHQYGYYLVSSLNEVCDFLNSDENKLDNLYLLKKYINTLLNNFNEFNYFEDIYLEKTTKGETYI